MYNVRIQTGKWLVTGLIDKANYTRLSAECKTNTLPYFCGTSVHNQAHPQHVVIELPIYIYEMITIEILPYDNTSFCVCFSWTWNISHLKLIQLLYFYSSITCIPYPRYSVSTHNKHIHFLCPVCTCMRVAAAGICLLKCFCRCFCWTFNANPDPRIPWKHVRDECFINTYEA